jgi:hypothetical protein
VGSNNEKAEENLWSPGWRHRPVHRQRRTIKSIGKGKAGKPKVVKQTKRPLYLPPVKCGGQMQGKAKVEGKEKDQEGRGRTGGVVNW